MTVRVGISGWSYPGWRGDFYPAGLAHRHELAHAASVLDSVEVNGSFYSLQRSSSWARWRDETPEGFRFAVKGSRYVTHLKRLRDVRQGLANFFASGLLGLGPRLGPLLWQTPAVLAYDAGLVAAFVSLLPRTVGEAVDLALEHDDKVRGDKRWSALDRPDDVPDRGRVLVHAWEPRHESFGSPEAVGQLAEAGVCLVVADTAGVFPRFDAAVGPAVYVRLHGEDAIYAGGYSDAGLDRWAERIRAWTADGRDAWCYFDNDGGGHAPWDALRLRQRFVTDQ
ncbi:DUF72 domain-containing protein [Nocardioides marmoraquaticus]